jgi:PAS domain S-box-containing protein
MEKYPDQIDSLHRYAEVYEAMGEKQKAAMKKDKMVEKIKALNVAIVGGGPGCKAIIDMISAEKLSQLSMKLIGVACTNPAAVGYRFAQEKGIYTTTDYHDLYKLKDLNMIIELTSREEVANEIARSKPEHVRFMDHEAARLFWDIFQIEEQRIAERKRAEERIEHLNLVLRAIRNVNQLITRERDRDKLIKGACDRLVETRGYYNAWIALLDKSGGFVTSAEARLGEGFLPLIESLKRGDLTDCGRRALSQSQVVVTKDPSSNCPYCPLSSMYSGRGGMTIRLEYGEKVYGILCASIPNDFISDKEEQTLFNEVADDIAFAIHDIELEQERNRAQERVRETVKKLLTIFDSVNDGLAIMDQSLTVQEVNKYRLELLGLNRDQVIGKKCYEVFQHRDKPCDICPVQPVFEKGEAVRLEKSAVLKDGTVKYFDTQGTPIFDDDGNVVQVVGSSRDITDRKRAEEALRESEEKYKKLVESSFTGIFIHQDGKYVFVNDKFAQIRGYTPEELLGKEYLTLTHPDDRDGVAQIVSKRLEGAPVSSRHEVQRLKKDGKTIWCEMMATHTKYRGRPAIMGNIIEITDRKRAEKTVRVAYEQAIIYAQELKEEIEEHKWAEEGKKKLEAQLLHAQKMESIGTLAGGVGASKVTPL